MVITSSDLPSSWGSDSLIVLGGQRIWCSNNSVMLERIRVEMCKLGAIFMGPLHRHAPRVDTQAPQQSQGRRRPC